MDLNCTIIVFDSNEKQRFIHQVLGSLQSKNDTYAIGNDVYAKR